DRMEQVLGERELYDRIAARIKKRQYDAVGIIEFEPALAKYFKSLNYEWLQKYHKVEPTDKKLLEDPEGQIISKGGAVIFARLDNETVGTGALIKHDDSTYEIAKMAVAEKWRGRQAGNKLTTTLIDRARKAGAERIFLETSPNMIPAISLYKKLGFVNCENIIPPRYERESITMMLSPQNIKTKGKKNEKRSSER
ncbi:MAG: GNAT family N-acetyltransferase, partial [Candidatus Zixiibacteriota bacterium]